MIEVQHLNLAFGEGEKRNQVLYDVSFHVKPGEIYGLVGESGSGKTTVLKCLAGLFTHWQGELTIDAQPLGHEISRERCRQVQMVFQDAVGSFNPRRKIGESISDTLCRLCGEKKHTAGKETSLLLEDVGLPGDYAEKYPHELSGGECQRAAIARAMSVHPEILICDEATSALDVSAQAKIVELLMHLRRIHNVSILFITHDLPLVSNISDRILIMNEGELVEEGSTEEVITRPKTVYTRRLLDAVC